MKIEMYSDNNFKFFISNLYSIDIDVENKEDLIKLVKHIVGRFKIKLNLHGFYKLKVYFNKKVGIFIEGIKIDDFSFSNNLDLRVLVCSDYDVYFCTDDYFAIKEYGVVRYFNNKFYCNVSDICDINSVVEYGNFIFGEDVSLMINNSLLV